MVFWIILWAVAFMVFVLLPVFTNPNARKLWLDRLCFFIRPNPSANPEPSPADEGEFHYRLSSQQEDEIRSGFLVDRLSSYTMTLAESDIRVLEDGGAVSTNGTDTSESAPGEDEQLAAEGTASFDIEAGVAHPADLEGEDDDDLKGTSDYDSIDDCSSDECMGEFDFDSECNGFVCVPFAGAPQSDDKAAVAAESGTKTLQKRYVPNGCAVCLSAFEPDDMVTWSSNEECKHVFHRDCILDWLNASGKRHLRRRRRQERQNCVLHYAKDPLLKITRFPMLCPCCRQVFVVNPDDDAQDHAIKEAAPEVLASAVTMSESNDTTDTAIDESSQDIAPAEHAAPTPEEENIKKIETQSVVASPIISLHVAGNDDTI